MLVFFYDILIYNANVDDHYIHLESVLKVLRQNNLFAKQNKCPFPSRSIEYLGNVITKDGVATDP